jgi:sugar phosphate isomerase/epimerase
MSVSFCLQACPTREDGSLREQYARADGLGLEALELLVPDRHDHEAHWLKNADQSIPVYAISGRCGVREVVAATEAVQELLILGQRWGASVVSVHFPGVEGRRLGNAQAAISARSAESQYRAAINLTYEVLDNLRPVAERVGIRLAVEVSNAGCFLSPIEMAEMIDAVPSWSLGLAVDMDRVSTVGDPYDWLITLGRRVAEVRSSVAFLEGEGRRLPGRLPPAGALAACLRTIDFDGPVVLRSGTVARLEEAWPTIREAFQQEWLNEGE